VGLGHAGRARVIANTLKKLIGNLTIEFVAAEPVFSYFKFWRERVLDISSELFSLSPLAEESYGRGKLSITLKLTLKEYEIVKRNAKLLEDHIDFERYDLIIGDEFWELIASKQLTMPPPKILMTDFISYPYRISNLITALVINRYLKSRMKLFSKRIYIGFKDSIPNQRWFFIIGDNVAEWTRKHFEICGPIPSFNMDELPDRNRMRKELGIEENEYFIIFSLGGTAVGKELMKLVTEVHRKLKQRIGSLRIGVAMGPRGGIIKSSIFDDVIMLNMPYDLYKAFSVADCVVTLAGLATITELLALGVPAVLLPLKGHYEQEGNAKIASKLRIGFIVEDLASITSDKLTLDIYKLLINKDKPKPMYGIYRNSIRVAHIISRELMRDETL
jgi:predicted glycosyltransferase